MKPKIYFIPAYLATLKHYERLIPYLKNAYSIGFLVLIKNPLRRAEVVEYCKSKHYEFYLMDKDFFREKKLSIPIFTILKRRLDESRAYARFLNEVRPSKIICHKTGHPYDTVLKEANRMGVETIILQVSTEKNFQRRVSSGYSLNLSWRLYAWAIAAISKILDAFDFSRREHRFQLTPAIPKKIGVFTDEEKRVWSVRGYDPCTIHVVGSVDFQSTHELKQKIQTDQMFKERLLQKYGLAQRKLKIVVVLFRYYMNLRDEDKMTIPEHVVHNYEVFKALRDIFRREDADIVLRVAPNENHMPHIYEPYKELDVTLCYGPQTQTDELVCLADLYVAEPLSSVNNLALAANVPSIFFNFSALRFLNNSASYFHIKHIMSDTNDFKQAIQQFKNGTLLKQYDNGHINLTSADDTVKLINL